MSGRIDSPTIGGNNALSRSIYDQETPDEVAQLIRESSKKDRATARGIGQAYDDATKAYMDAIKQGTAKEISAAKVAFEKAALVFQMFLQTTSNCFQIMLTAIQKTVVR